MKKFLLSLITFIIPFFTFAQELSTSERIDLNFKKYTGWFVDGIFYEIPFFESFQIPWVLIVLIGGALYFTIYFKLINVTGFYTAVKVVRGKYEDKPLKVKDIRPMLKNIRIRSKSKQKDAEDENRQNPQNYAEYKTSTASKKVAEKSILAVTFSAKRLKIKEKQHATPTSEEPGKGVDVGTQVMQFSAKKQQEKKVVS